MPLITVGPGGSGLSGFFNWAHLKGPPPPTDHPLCRILISDNCGLAVFFPFFFRLHMDLFPIRYSFPFLTPLLFDRINLLCIFISPALTFRGILWTKIPLLWIGLGIWAPPSCERASCYARANLPRTVPKSYGPGR